MSDSPFTLFQSWYDEALKLNVSYPNAMSLATASRDGFPAVRMVLLKGWNEEGFVFYTNLGSAKAHHLAENPEVSACFFWDSLHKQIRVTGSVVPVTDTEADTYFASRARTSQLGAWASKQSQVMEGRFDLEKRVAQFAARYPVGAIPRPPFWSGFRIQPRQIEFWQERQFRLHERVLFKKTDTGWVKDFLYP